MSASGILACLVVAALALAGCESSQERSAQLKRQGAHALLGAKGLSVSHELAGVKVVGRAVLHDENGGAVVVTLRNEQGRALADLPIAIDVQGGNGRSVFRNNLPGLDPSLTHVSLLMPGQTATWVNDQIDLTGTPRDVDAKVGEPKPRTVPAKLPEIRLSAVKLETDPVDGVEAVGKAKLVSGPDQRSLVVSCVARKGTRIVAAGRSVIPRLSSVKARPFHIFFIGNPRGARLDVVAPPTVL